MMNELMTAPPVCGAGELLRGGQVREFDHPLHRIVFHPLRHCGGRRGCAPILSPSPRVPDHVHPRNANHHHGRRASSSLGGMLRSRLQDGV